MIPREEWKWYGNAAHFCCGQWCRFHLATEIGDVMVSTVGHYVHPRDSGGSEDTEYKYLAENPFGEDVSVGYKYETMVFRTTDERCTHALCGCGMPRLDFNDIAGDRYHTAEEATKGHMEMCERFASEERSS